MAFISLNIMKSVNKDIIDRICVGVGLGKGIWICVSAIDTWRAIYNTLQFSQPNFFSGVAYDWPTCKSKDLTNK